MTRTPSASSATIERFSGFADQYDRYRPPPPTELATVLAQFRMDRNPQLVVDLGSGTGLSTRYWASRAEQVIGVEPSGDMCREAARQSTQRNVRYLSASAQSTGLPSQCAQIVTCVQALHWMEPQATFREVARILRPGGIFAAVDYDWPPMIPSWDATQAWMTCLERVKTLERELPRERQARSWDKARHLARMASSGCFAHVREILLHHWEPGNDARFIGLLRSQGGVMSLLKAGRSEQDLGLPGFEGITRAALGAHATPWLWCARVRLGTV